MKFYAVESLSPKRHFTPEGFLVCEDVPLARVGEQLYGPDETPIRAGADGLVRVLREPQEVFRDATIASAQGKPVVRDHPDSLEVNPRSWRDLAKGHIINPRRGVGSDADVMLGDLMITDADEIRRVVEDFEAGIKPEVSMGYDCDYDAIGEDGSGLGRQRNIVFNHVALVDQGRCGPRCAIGDAPNKGVKRMAATIREKKGIFDSIRRAFKAGDKEKIEDAIKDAEEKMCDAGESAASGETPHIENHVHVNPAATDDSGDPEMQKRVDSIEKEMRDGFKKIGDAMDGFKKALDAKKGDEGEKESEEEKKKKEAEDKKLGDELEEESPSGSGDKARKAKDSVYLEESFQRTTADAEIMAPGMHIASFDQKAPPAKTFDSICQTRRRALDIAMGSADVRAHVDGITRGRGFDSKTATCDATRMLFNSVAAMVRSRNNRDNTTDANRMARGGDRGNSGAPQSIADLNKMNAARRADRMATAAGASARR